MDLSAHFKMQTLLICEAIVCGSEPAQCLQCSAMDTEILLQLLRNRQEVQMKRTKMGRKAVDQEDKSDGKDSIQLSRGWHFVMDGPRPRIQNNRIAVGEKSQTGVKL